MRHEHSACRPKERMARFGPYGVPSDRGPVEESAVALYEYRCDQDGSFDVMRPLGTAPASVACAVCGAESRRVFSVSMLRTGTRPAWTAAIDRADKSRYEPEVVRSLPPVSGPRRTIELTPMLRGLPRP